MVVSVEWLQIITWKNRRFTERVPGHSRLNQRWRPSKLWRASLENPGLKWTKMDYENHDQPAPSACLMYASSFCWVRGPYVIVIYCNYLFFWGEGGYRRLRVRKISFKMAPVFVIDGPFWEMWEVDGRFDNFSVSKFNKNSRNVSPTR